MEYNKDVDLNSDGVMSDEEIELYRKHVVYYFDTQMNSDILNLTDADKSKFFQMFTDYSDILEKIWHPGIPIIEHILYGDQFKSAKEKPHDGIVWKECEIVKQYEQWKKSKD